MAGFFTVVMLSSVGLPGSTASSASSSCSSAVRDPRWWTVVAAAGVILAALYLLWAYQRVFHGEPDAENA